MPRKTNNPVFNQTLDNAKKLHTDLLEMDIHEDSCEICSKYQGKIYSISGADNRFPKLPDIVLKTGTLHEGCRHVFYPYIYGISTPLAEQYEKIKNTTFDKINKQK